MNKNLNVWLPALVVAVAAAVGGSPVFARDCTSDAQCAQGERCEGGGDRVVIDEKEQESLVTIGTCKPIRSCRGRRQIPQTWGFDFDHCALGGLGGSDIWFQAVTATERFITPVNGAVIARIPLPQPSINDCVNALRQGSIEKWPVAGEPGIPFCYRTAAGGMGYFSVVAPVGPSPGKLVINVQSF